MSCYRMKTLPLTVTLLQLCLIVSLSRAFVVSWRTVQSNHVFAKKTPFYQHQYQQRQQFRLMIEEGEEAEDTDDDDYNDNDKEYRSMSSDWIEAEWTLANNSPLKPSPDLDVAKVAVLCCRSLQWIDYPTPMAGLKRCFEFFTPACREVVTARQGGKTMERFLQYAILAPALQPFMGASRVMIRMEESTMIAAKPPLRGALWSVPVEIHGAPILSVQHPSGMHRSGIATSPPVTNMVIRLEEQRRPPFQGCWMVREILDVRHAFAGDMGNAHVGA